MDYAKRLLEHKLKELITHRESMRKTARRKDARLKDKGFGDMFSRWSKEATQNIKSIKKALKVLQ
jgi:hypothetical protein